MEARLKNRRMFLQEMALLNIVRRGEADPKDLFGRTVYKLKTENPWVKTPVPEGPRQKNTTTRNIARNVMSHFINPIFLPNKEDWERYEQTSCSLKHWPDMWEGEIAAEAALYRQRMNPPFYPDWNIYPLSHRRNRTRSHNPIIVALVQLADECEWQTLFTSPSTGKSVYKIR